MEINEDKEEMSSGPDIQKVYIKDYGNLVLEIKGSSEIGLLAYSKKRNETLFIPWCSIIMVSKLEKETEDNNESGKN